MSRTRAAVALSLVVLLALCSSKMAVAGPPEERSSAMKLDKLAEGLRQYQLCRAEGQRVEWLKRLAPSRDPRVEAALYEALRDSCRAVSAAAGSLLRDYYVPPVDNPSRIVMPRGAKWFPVVPRYGPPEI